MPTQEVKLKPLKKKTKRVQKKANKALKGERILKNEVQEIQKQITKLKIGKQPMTKKISKRLSYNSRDFAKKYMSYQQSYTRALMVPEYSRWGKIPSVFPQPTASLHKHMTVPFTANASGKCAILINPFILSDTTAAISNILINNAAGLNLNTPETTTGYTVIASPFNIPVNVVSEYRLVSASVRIDPQMSIQNAQGTIGGGIAVYGNQAQYLNTFTAGTTSVAVANGSELTVASTIDNLMYFAKANITDLESIRHIYFPLDPSYEIYTPMNSVNASSGSAFGSTFYFAYYITGAPASSAFNLEIYLNFEYIPTPKAEAYIQTNAYLGGEDASKVVKTVSTRPEYIVQANRDISTNIEKLDMMDAGDKGFFSNAFDFLTNHSGSIFKGISSLISMF